MFYTRRVPESGLCVMVGDQRLEWDCMKHVKLARRNVRFMAAASISAVALLLVAGCGSSPSAPPATATPQPTKASGVPTKTASTGTIVFGAAVSGHTVTKPNTVFKTPKHTFAWVATLSPKPSSGNVTVTVVRTAGALVHPDTVWTFSLPISASVQYANYTMTGAKLIAHNIIATGTYSLTYTQAGQTLATGSFQISTHSGGSGTSY
jgi:hypothetical protein